MRRVRAAIVLAVCAALLTPTVALGWSNGPAGPDTYGTHDWALLEAKRIAVANNVKWLDWSAAQPRTDDPDTVLNDSYHHVYDAWGDTYGDAPDQIGLLYAQTVYQLRYYGNVAASKKMALLAHYYADICNPLHTDQTDAEVPIHSAYEHDVDVLTDTMGENRAWVVPGSMQYRYDIVGASRNAATSAHGLYNHVISDYPVGGEPAVRDATQWGLNRAANDLADVIYSVQRATRTKAYRTSCGVVNHYPRQYTTVKAISRVTDSAGRPIPGVRVSFRWKFKTVTHTMTSSTNAAGYAYCSRYISGAAKGYKVTVTAKATSAGVTKSGTTWFIPK